MATKVLGIALNSGIKLQLFIVQHNLCLTNCRGMFGSMKRVGQEKHLRGSQKTAQHKYVERTAVLKF